LGFLEKSSHVVSNMRRPGQAGLCVAALSSLKTSTLLGKRRKVVFIMGSLMFQPLSRWLMHGGPPSLAGYCYTVFGCYILICESVAVRFESTAVQHSDREFHVWIGSLPKIVRFEFYHIFRGKGPEEKFTVARMMFVWGDFKAYTVY
jgi:hypothetical protein